MSGAFYASYVVLWVLVIVLAALLLLVYRHFGMMALGTIQGVSRDGIPVGEAAPDLSVTTVAGDQTVIRPGASNPEMLVFAAPDCEPCAVVLPYLNHLAGKASAPNVVAVVPGPPETAERMIAEYGLSYGCLAEDGSGAFDVYRVRVTPFAFVVRDGKVLSKGLCSEPTMVRDLLVAAGLDAAVPEPLPLAPNGERQEVRR